MRRMAALGASITIGLLGMGLAPAAADDTVPSTTSTADRLSSSQNRL